MLTDPRQIESARLHGADLDPEEKAILHDYWRSQLTGAGLNSIAGGAGNVGGGYTQPQQWGTAGTTATTNGAANAASGGGGYTLPQGDAGGGGGGGSGGGTGGGSSGPRLGGSTPLNTGGGTQYPVDPLSAAINDAAARQRQQQNQQQQGNTMPSLSIGPPARNPSYGDLFGQNQNLYNATVGGYQNAMNLQGANQQAIDEMQRNGYNAVMGTLDNIGASARQDIADQYAQAQGQATQDLISRGLGNSTVTSSVNRGLQYDQAKANVALANQLAAQRAGYQTHFTDLGVQSAQQYGASMNNLAAQAAGYTGNYGNLLTQLENSNRVGDNSNYLSYAGLLSGNQNAANSIAAQQQSQAYGAQTALQQQLLQAQLQAQLQQQQYYMQYGGGVGDYGYYGG